MSFYFPRGDTKAFWLYGDGLSSNTVSIFKCPRCSHTLKLSALLYKMSEYFGYFFFLLAPFWVHRCSTVGNAVFSSTLEPLERISRAMLIWCIVAKAKARSNLNRISREMNDAIWIVVPIVVTIRINPFSRETNWNIFFPEKCSHSFKTRCGSWAHELPQNFQVHRKNFPRRRKSCVNNPRLNKAFKLIPKSRLKKLGKSICVDPCLYFSLQECINPTPFLDTAT